MPSEMWQQRIRNLWLCLPTAGAACRAHGGYRDQERRAIAAPGEPPPKAQLRSQIHPCKGEGRGTQSRAMAWRRMESGGPHQNMTSCIQGGVMKIHIGFAATHLGSCQSLCSLVVAPGNYLISQLLSFLISEMQTEATPTPQLAVRIKLVNFVKYYLV